MSGVIPSPMHARPDRGTLRNAVRASLLCLAALAGCTTPRVSVTDASPDGIRFLVRDALLVPWGAVDEQAASHCRAHDMTWRRSGSERSAPGSLMVSYECVPAADTRRTEVRRTPPRQPGVAEKAAQPDLTAGQAFASVAQGTTVSRRTAIAQDVQTSSGAPTQSAPADRKAAAWQKAKTATDAWAQCLQHGAERRAKEGDDPPQAAAQAVLDGCSTLERAVHEPLRAAGEETPGFQTDLHTQAVQRVSQTIVQGRLTGGRRDAAAERVGAVEAAGR